MKSKRKKQCKRVLNAFRMYYGLEAPYQMICTDGVENSEDYALWEVLTDTVPFR